MVIILQHVSQSGHRSMCFLNEPEIFTFLFKFSLRNSAKTICFNIILYNDGTLIRSNSSYKMYVYSATEYSIFEICYWQSSLSQVIPQSQREHFPSGWSGRKNHKSGGYAAAPWAGPTLVWSVLPDQQWAGFFFYATIDCLNTLFHYS